MSAAASGLAGGIASLVFRSTASMSLLAAACPGTMTRATGAALERAFAGTQVQRGHRHGLRMALSTVGVEDPQGLSGVCLSGERGGTERQECGYAAHVYFRVPAVIALISAITFSGSKTDAQSGWKSFLRPRSIAMRAPSENGDPM